MANGGAKDRATMVLRISGMPDGELKLAFEVDAAELGIERFAGPITVDGSVRKVSTQVFVQCAAAGTFIGECDRCLAEVRQRVEAPINLFYQVSTDTRGAIDDNDGDMRTLHPEQDTIELDDEVRQALLLAVPLKVLCGDDCAGICAGCGANLNIEKCRCEEPPVDPRWAKLADLYKKDDKN